MSIKSIASDSMASLDREEIRLEEYQAKWSKKFNEERLRLLEHPALGNVQIAHIGSTAVVGMTAKPTVDILLGVDHTAAMNQSIQALSDAGYDYHPEYEARTPERLFFIRRNGVGERDFHLSVVQINSQFWWRHIVFRNRLREDSALRSEYCALKSILARKHRFARKQYVNGKSAFIRRELERSVPAVVLQGSGNSPLSPTDTGSAPARAAI